LNLKEVIKPLAKKFASSASLVKGLSGSEINIQGDVMFEVADYLVETFKQIDKKVIFFIEKGIKKKAF